MIKSRWSLTERVNSHNDINIKTSRLPWKVNVCPQELPLPSSSSCSHLCRWTIISRKLASSSQASPFPGASFPLLCPQKGKSSFFPAEAHANTSVMQPKFWQHPPWHFLSLSPLILGNILKLSAMREKECISFRQSTNWRLFRTVFYESVFFNWRTPTYAMHQGASIYIKWQIPCSEACPVSVFA